jgi:hypothetical protein
VGVGTCWRVSWRQCKTDTFQRMILQRLEWKMVQVSSLNILYWRTNKQPGSQTVKILRRHFWEYLKLNMMKNCKKKECDFHIVNKWMVRDGIH